LNPICEQRFVFSNHGYTDGGVLAMLALHQRGLSVFAQHHIDAAVRAECVSSVREYRRDDRERREENKSNRS
jgi:hypothetical protein